MWEVEDELLAAIIAGLRTDGFPIAAGGVFFTTGQGMGHLAIDYIEATVRVIGDVSQSTVDLCDPGMLDKLKTEIIAVSLAAAGLDRHIKQLANNG